MFVSQGPGGALKTLGDPGSTLTSQRIRRGTVRRMLSYLGSHRLHVALLLLTTVANAIIVVATPLLLREIIDNGILRGDRGLITTVAGVLIGLALLDTALQLAMSLFAARIGQGVSYDLRVRAFAHVQRQPLAFFTRAQTGALTSRLNTDVVGAQQALTALLVSLSGLFTVVLIVIEMFYLSWLISLFALVVMPIFLVPSALVGRRLQRYSREQMQVNAEMGATINERFNVAGAMLSKLFGREQEEKALFEGRARRVREIGVTWSVYSRLAFVLMTMLATVITAIVYSVGGLLVLDQTFALGTLVALAALLARLYGPITQIASIQANALTATVSFDRIFEVLDLRPLIVEKPDAVELAPAATGDAPEIRFDRVSFAYPRAADVSLASLETIAVAEGERTRTPPEVLHRVSFRAPAGRLTALVGPSGAGKTTITQLISRLYDPAQGSVRIGGTDLRDVTIESLRRTVGVVTQDAHFFHDTIRNNLLYARPDATDEEITEACEAARIRTLIESLPSGLDTVVGDRGYRLSGGEKQRLALARLLLKAPSIVVLDEATAHLDSESEAAIQRALETALRGRTSVVIAHRLSTVREADQILVIDDGRVRERGTHDELLIAGGLYADLYRTQFSRQADGHRDEPEPEPEPEPEIAPEAFGVGLMKFKGGRPVPIDPATPRDGKPRVFRTAD